VIVSVVGRFGLYRRAGALVLLTLATVAYGCGSSVPTESVSAGKNPAKLIPEDQLYKYEGTGAAKHKVDISRRERIKLLHEAAKKAD
jgi:hypothetical protein